jgi:hypothetical protein
VTNVTQAAVAHLASIDDPLRITRGGAPYLVYSGQQVVDAFKAGTRHREQARADDGWQPIATAPRDGTRVLVILRDPLPDDRPDLARWAGVPFVARNRGDSSDWCFAAPVGCGGWPDEWLVGWRPLPRSLSAAQGEG